MNYPEDPFKDLEPEPPIIVPGLDIADITAAELKLPEQLIKGLLYRGTKMVIAGGSKSYKTWLLMHLAYCLSQSRHWLGFETARCHIGYCNLELKAAIFNERLIQLQNAMRVQRVDGSFFVHHFRDTNVPPTKLYEAVLASVKNPIYDVVIIDPVYKLLANKDENSARDMANLMFELERIASENYVAVIFGHHYPKGASANKDPLDRLAGSGVFGRDLDTVMTLTPHQEDLCFTADFILRNHKPINPVVFRWNYPLFELDKSLDPAKLRGRAGRPVLIEPEDILELLREHDDTFSTTEFQELCCEHFRLSRASFYRKWDLLKAQKKVFVSKLNNLVNLRA